MAGRDSSVGTSSCCKHSGSWVQVPRTHENPSHAYSSPCGRQTEETLGLFAWQELSPDIQNTHKNPTQPTPLPVGRQTEETPGAFHQADFPKYYWEILCQGQVNRVENGRGRHLVPSSELLCSHRFTRPQTYLYVPHPLTILFKVS